MSHLTICLIICVLTMISYVIGKFPIGLTAMLSMVAFVITGCIDPNTALSYFGNANGVMMLSMFVVAAGFNRTQFVKKRASSVNKIAKGSLTRVMFGYDIKSLIKQSLVPAIILCLVSVFWIMTVFPIYP